MGPTMQDMPDISWKYVQKEKSADMLHVLQFPYNGEPPRVRNYTITSAWNNATNARCSRSALSRQN